MSQHKIDEMLDFINLMRAEIKSLKGELYESYNKVQELQQTIHEYEFANETALANTK